MCGRDDDDGSDTGVGTVVTRERRLAVGPAPPLAKGSPVKHIMSSTQQVFREALEWERLRPRGQGRPTWRHRCLKCGPTLDVTLEILFGTKGCSWCGGWP